MCEGYWLSSMQRWMRFEPRSPMPITPDRVRLWSGPFRPES
jgi:hypothetical protein